MYCLESVLFVCFFCVPVHVPVSFIYLTVFIMNVFLIIYRLAWSWVGGRLAPFYIHQMNGVRTLRQCCRSVSWFVITMSSRNESLTNGKELAGPKRPLSPYDPLAQTMPLLLGLNGRSIEVSMINMCVKC